MKEHKKRVGRTSPPWPSWCQAVLISGMPCPGKVVRWNAHGDTGYTRSSPPCGTMPGDIMCDHSKEVMTLALRGFSAAAMKASSVAPGICLAALGVSGQVLSWWQGLWLLSGLALPCESCGRPPKLKASGYKAAPGAIAAARQDLWPPMTWKWWPPTHYHHPTTMKQHFDKKSAYPAAPYR